MEDNNDTSGPSPQASPKLHGRPRDTLMWSNQYNSALMGSSVPPSSIGMYLPSQNVNEKEPNKKI